MPTSLNEEASSCGGGGDINISNLVPYLVIAVTMALVFILIGLIKCYKKDMKLKRAAEANDHEHDITILERRSSSGGGEEEKLVLELKALSRVASVEELGKWDFGNCYKAVTQTGHAFMVKRLVDLRPLRSDEFMRQMRAIAEIEHPNLLPLHAYYKSKEGERLFLYPFAPYGNLFDRLHGNLGILIVIVCGCLCVY